MLNIFPKNRLTHLIKNLTT